MASQQSSDPIAAAMIETEKEVAGFAWDNEDTEAADATGDRSLEGMGDGLEGQNEAEDDEVVDGDEAEGDEESEGEPKPITAEKPAGEVKPEVKPLAAEQPIVGRVPAGKHREVLDRARAAETERDALKAASEKREAESNARFDLLTREIAALKTAPRSEPAKVEAAKAEVIPDIFEDPKGFAEHLTNGFKSELSKRDAQLANQRVETSMALAHLSHKDTFEKAYAEISKLNVGNPDDRATVQRIYNSPNPGEALVSWHKRQQTFAEVGDDPTAYRERVRKETREALAKDPEFRKALIADMRKDAERGDDDGAPRNVTRLPRSLARASGSNLGAERIDPNANDGSPEEIANAAWR